jgi:flagellar biosynthesis protein FlhG
MSDQADGLRQLVQARSAATAVAEPPEPVRNSRAPAKARSLLLTSGKGGVGTSNVALNLAIALGEQGQQVVLMDADLWPATIDLLCGITRAHDFGAVLSGDRLLSEVVIEGPAGVQILPGAHGMRTLADVLGAGPSRLAAELAALESDADILIVDAGSGLGAGIATLAAAADEVVVVTTPEPSSVADAHATIGRLCKLPGVQLRALVNQAGSAVEADDVLDRLCASSRQFLGAAVSPLGFVLSDPRVSLAVRTRRPFVVAHPGAPAARSIARLARTLVAERQPKARRAGFFASLAARRALSRIAR